MIVAVCRSHVITLVHIIIALPRTSGEKKKKKGRYCYSSSRSLLEKTLEYFFFFFLFFFFVCVLGYTFVLLMIIDMHMVSGD